jgi:predicted phosphodiesterase
MKKVDVAREYRARYGFEINTSKLARIMYAENELLFSNFEDARKNLRYIEGKTGKGNRKYIKPEYILKERTRTPFKYIEKENYEPFVINGLKRIAVLNDIHLPYTDKDALITAIDWLKKVKPDGILLNGDIIDCYTLSRYLKDPKKRDFKYELDCLKNFFDDLIAIFGCRIFYKLGNHESRYEHFLQMKMHELKGIEEFEFKNIIKAREKGIDVIESNRIIKMNSLNGIHGHEYFGGGSGVNVARGMFARAMTSGFCGHHHKTSEHTETDMNGKIITTWSVGCLSHLHPEYMPLNKWNHGFAFVELDKNGEDFLFHNKRIYKGKVL